MTAINARRILLMVFTGLVAGCATVANESTHMIQLDTATPTGQLVKGAECRLSNDFGTVIALSGDSVRVRRSSDDLAIVCRHPAHPDAVGRVFSRATAGMLGNVIAGGTIGALVDHGTGNAYGYPPELRLVFGRSIMFDRNGRAQDVQPAKPEAAR